MCHKKRIILCIMLFIFISCLEPSIKMKALIRMIDQQEKYFKENIIPSFEKEEKAEIQVVHYDNVDVIDGEIDKYKGQVGLVKVPFEKAPSLVSQS